MAIGELLSVLRRAPIDGMADGPEVAARVEAGVQQARSTNDPMAIDVTPSVVGSPAPSAS